MERRTLRILVVDDNRASATALAKLLQKLGDEVQAVFDGEAAIRELDTFRPDVVLTDLRMEPVDGMAVLEAARSRTPAPDVFVFTAYGAIDTAVRAMRLGARDFLTKPVTVEQIEARLDALRSPQVEVAPTEMQDVVASSAAGRTLIDLLGRAADVPSPVWIEGEVGTGRTYAAEVLHRLSNDRMGSSLPLTLRDPGTDAPWPERGSVVLSNIDDLADDQQRTLVRMLGLVPRDVRLMATAQPGGLRRVRDGEIRPELYFRLAVLVVTVPPLRDRQDDIVPMFQAQLKRFSTAYRRPLPVPDREVIHAVARHTWPGNVRELMNAAERAVVMGIEHFQIQPFSRGPAPVAASGVPELEPGFNLQEHMENVERAILEAALSQCDGDRNRVGKLLGVERNTLKYKLLKHGLAS